MREYLLRRLLLLIPTMLGVTFIVFLMMRFIPGDPVTNMMGETYSAEDAQKLRHELGLDQPMIVQYGKYLCTNNFTCYHGSSRCHTRCDDDLVSHVEPSTR